MSRPQVPATASTGGGGAAGPASQPPNQTSSASNGRGEHAAGDSVPHPSAQGGDRPAHTSAGGGGAHEQRTGGMSSAKGDAIRPAASTAGEEPQDGAQHAPTRPKQGRGVRSHDMNPVTRRRLAAAYGMPVPGQPPSLPQATSDGRGRVKEPHGRVAVSMPPVPGAAGPSDAEQKSLEEASVRTGERRQKRKADAKQGRRGGGAQARPQRGSERSEAETGRAEDEKGTRKPRGKGRQQLRKAQGPASGPADQSGNNAQPVSPRHPPGGTRTAPSRASAGAVSHASAGPGAVKSARHSAPPSNEGFSREVESLLRNIERAKQVREGCRMAAYAPLLAALIRLPLALSPPQDLVSTEEKLQRARAHHQELMRRRVHEASRSGAAGRSTARATQSMKGPAAPSADKGRQRATTARRPATQSYPARKARAVELVTEPTPHDDIERLMVAAEGREGKASTRANANAPKRPATPAMEGPVSPRLLQRLETEAHRRAQELSVAQDRVQGELRAPVARGSWGPHSRPRTNPLSRSPLPVQLCATRSTTLAWRR